MGRMNLSGVEGLAYLTADEPGIGGVLKAEPEDFVVEEVPLRQAGDQGDFLYLLVEKRQRLTTDVVRLFSRHFKAPWSAIGYAGLKDKRAITRQWFSIEHGKEEVATSFADPAIGILQMTRDNRPLRRGALRANRFRIKIRGVHINDVLRARRIFDRLIAGGVPNFIGRQRFGYRNDYHMQGIRLLKGDLKGFLDGLLGRPRPQDNDQEKQARELYEQGRFSEALERWATSHRCERQALGPLSRKAPLEDVINGIDLPHRQLMISAFQSVVFNRLLDQRLQRRQFAALQPGDIVMDHAAHEWELIHDPAAHQARCDKLEISPTGPMWGLRLPQAGGEIGRTEHLALAATGVSEADLAASEYRPEGSRRYFRMLIEEPDIRAGSDERGPYIQLAFQLQRGCFGTTLMREIMKNEVQGSEFKVQS